MKAKTKQIEPPPLPFTVGIHGLASRMERRLIGQKEAIYEITPYVDLFHAGLSPYGRPIGSFMLLGSTGVGKSRTVEILAEELHGKKGNFIRIDCGEFQMDHEVAKLLSAPPGYLGHKETVSLLSQQRLSAVTSEHSNISIILFDEIEKAASPFSRVLLGILDKGVLTLGDNQQVKFDNCLIFMTSNLGAAEFKKYLNPNLTVGFSREDNDKGKQTKDLKKISTAALEKRYSPEFVNRIDCAITYSPLSRADVRQILDLELESLQDMIDSRLSENCFTIDLTPQAREWIIDRGFNPKYGAREIKRVLQKSVLRPAAAMYTSKILRPGMIIKASLKSDSIILHAENRGE